MIVLYRITVFLLLAVAGNSQNAQLIPIEPVAEAEGRSMDSTESIIIVGSEQEVRSRILGIAMDIREEVYGLVGLNENTQEHALEVNLYGEFGESPPQRLSKKSFEITAGRLNLRLDLHLAKGVNEELLEQDLTELFLYEIGMREVDMKEQTELAFRLPHWLTHGVLEAVRWNKDQVDRQLYARLYKQQAIYPMEELLEEENVEADSGIMNHAFKVSSGVLVKALLNQPQGKEGLLALLKEAPSYDGEKKLLISKHFPDTTLSKDFAGLMKHQAILKTYCFKKLTQ